MRKPAMKIRDPPDGADGKTGYGPAMTAVETDAGPGPQTPLVFASPHSGAEYPDDMGAAAGLSDTALRSAEDAQVDRLIAPGRAAGAAVIAGLYGRAYLDLNRDPGELDPLLIEGVATEGISAKVRAGYGVLPRLSGDGVALYDRRLTLEEARDRIARVHAPYHAELARLMQAARARHGRAVLVDWHSMPARAGAVDVVLGDRHGAACGAAFSRRLRSLFEQLGWRVALNQPYAGGYSTQTWGRPAEGHEALQVEISRRLYWDEAARGPGPGYERCRRGLERVIAALCRGSDRLV
jgi:N-formylglutamate amidohydrolase